MTDIAGPIGSLPGRMIAARGSRDGKIEIKGKYAAFFKQRVEENLVGLVRFLEEVCFQDAPVPSVAQPAMQQ